jgi:hypothetical protein
VARGWCIATRTKSPPWYTPPPAGGAARRPCKWSTVWAVKSRAARSGDSCLAVREWERRVPVPPREAGCDAPLTGRTPAPSGGTGGAWMAHRHAHQVPCLAHTTPGRWCGATAMQVERRLGGETACGAQRRHMPRCEACGGARPRSPARGGTRRPADWRHARTFRRDGWRVDGASPRAPSPLPGTHHPRQVVRRDGHAGGAPFGR